MTNTNIIRHHHHTLLLTACALIAGALSKPVAAATGTAPVAAAAAPGTARQHIRLNLDWRFHCGEVAVTNEQSNKFPVSQWRLTVVDGNAPDAAKLSAPELNMSGSGWQDAKSGEDAFKSRVGSAWFRTTLPKVAGDEPVVHFAGVDDNATVYLHVGGRNVLAVRAVNELKSVKLKGVNLHHDNGILGAEGFAWAEERRLRLMKEMGGNPTCATTCGAQPGNMFQFPAAEFWAALDVCGYNYEHYTRGNGGGYVESHEKFPNRLMFGTESQMVMLHPYWRMVMAHDYVLGDCVWAGMDYLGEVGTGESPGAHKDFPGYLANSGSYDICGFPKAHSYYRKLVWTMDRDGTVAPTVAMVVRRKHSGPTLEWYQADWGWMPALNSWTWPEFSNKVRFKVAGAATIAAVGNSNPGADLPHDYHGTTATTYDGRCLLVVRSTSKPGPLTITATCDGLGQGTLTIKNEPAQAGTAPLTSRQIRTA